MHARLYVIPLSHPAVSARLMLDHKGIDHRRVWLLSGLHPIQLRLLGFRGGTVPAMRIDSKRVQGSLAISRYLDEFHPSDPLFPADPAERQAVEEAEDWGGHLLQEVPRRLFRWALVREVAVRKLLARANRLPFPGVMAPCLKPIAMIFAHHSRATDETVRRDLEQLPRLLDHADALVERGVIGVDKPNAATFQIGPSLRLLLNLQQLKPRIEQRPSLRFARELLPEHPGAVAEAFPEAWLPPPSSA